jgi:exopolyphosphatase/pppGpp-phosphohydrolase
VQLALLKRSIANTIREIRFDIPLQHVTHMVAIGGDVRFAASHILEGTADESVREIARDAFLAFCDQIALLDEEQPVDRFRLPAVDAETLVPSLLVYRELLSATAASRLVISEASLRTGVLLDVAEGGGRVSADDFDRGSSQTRKLLGTSTGSIAPMAATSGGGAYLVAAGGPSVTYKVQAPTEDRVGAFAEVGGLRDRYERRAA